MLPLKLFFSKRGVRTPPQGLVRTVPHIPIRFKRVFLHREATARAQSSSSWDKLASGIELWHNLTEKNSEQYIDNGSGRRISKKKSIPFSMDSDHHPPINVWRGTYDKAHIANHTAFVCPAKRGDDQTTNHQHVMLHIMMMTKPPATNT